MTQPTKGGDASHRGVDVHIDSIKPGKVEVSGTDGSQPTNWETEVRSIAEYLGCNEGELVSEISKLLTSQREALIEQFEKEVIGEDEKPQTPLNKDWLMYRNQLRATQRQQLAKIKEGV